MKTKHSLGKGKTGDLLWGDTIPLPITYHVVITPLAAKPIFSDERTCNNLAYLLFEATAIHKYGLFAFCIMPDHAHILCRPGNVSIHHFVSLIQFRFEYVIMKNGGRSSIWQPAFRHDTLPEEQIIPTAMFILENPVRNGIVSNINEYPFSFAFGGKNYDPGERRTRI